MNCLYCGTENPDDAVYCSNCGKPLSETINLGDGVVCPVCGSRNTRDSAFCATCGKPLAAEPDFAGTDTIPFTQAGKDGIAPILPPPERRKNSGIAIIAALAVSALLILTALLLVYKVARKPDQPQTESTDSAETDEALRKQLETALDEHETIREWFDARTQQMSLLELSDADSTRLRDLDNTVGHLNANDYQGQLDFIDKVNSFAEEIYAAYDVPDSYKGPESVSTSAAAAQTADCSMSIDRWDLSEFPLIRAYITVIDRASNREVDTLTEHDFYYTWQKASGSEWSLGDISYNAGTGQYELAFQSDGSETAEDMQSERHIEIGLDSDAAVGRCESAFIPASLLADDLLSGYLNAYIEDVNSHSFSKLLSYIETDVDETDNYTLFYQMRKELSGGFIRSLHQELKEYHIHNVTVYDSRTLHLYSTETYDGKYEMLYSEWKNEGLNIADSIVIFTGPISGDPSVVVSAYVTQNPEYLLRKNANGQWKFYSYTGDLSLNQNWSVYDASVS